MPTHEEPPHFYLGVDVGGTKTEICLVSMPGRILIRRDRMPTLRLSSFEDFLARLGALIDQSLQQSIQNQNLPSEFTLHQFAGVGIGLPGSIDPETQKILQGSIPFLKNQSLIPAFKKVFKNYSGPLHFENDANCFALAEAHFGAGASWVKANQVPLEKLCLVGITLGTGLGGGLIANGTLLRGSKGGAGEIGHLTLIESGHPCYCGKRGCTEQYLSGTAFERLYQEKTASPHPLSGKEIFKKIENHDALAIATLDRYRDLLITFLSNVSNFINPHVIVLGGGMSSQKRIYTGIQERLSQECFLTKNPPAVLENEYGDSAGVVGAALLSLHEKGKP